VYVYMFVSVYVRVYVSVTLTLPVRGSSPTCTVHPSQSDPHQFLRHTSNN